MKTKILLIFFIILSLSVVGQTNICFRKYTGNYSEYLENPDRLEISQNPKKYTVTNVFFKEVIFEGEGAKLAYKYDSIQNIVSGLFKTENFVYELHGVNEGEGYAFVVLFDKSNIVQGIIVFNLNEKFCQEIYFVKEHNNEDYKICRIN